MRKALLAIVLVAASFAGGAAANGPGLRWAQSLVLDYLGGDAGDDDLGAPKVEDETEPIPSTPVPPLVVEPGDAGQAPAPGSSVAAQAPPEKAPDGNRTPRPASPSTPLDAPVDDRIALARAPGPGSETPPLEALDPLPLTAPGETPEKAKTTDSTRLSEPAELAKAPEPRKPAASAEIPAPAEIAAGPGESDDHWPDAPGSAPAAAVPPRPQGQAGPEGSTATGADVGPGKAPADWAAIRRRMKELGVARYGIEGEPGGRVRFHCVIPLAGRRAVGQQFEAEGDDEMQAAEVALRRVALWRATEAAAP